MKKIPPETPCYSNDTIHMIITLHWFIDGSIQYDWHPSLPQISHCYPSDSPWLPCSKRVHRTSTRRSLWSGGNQTFNQTFSTSTVYPRVSIINHYPPVPHGSTTSNPQSWIKSFWFSNLFVFSTILPIRFSNNPHPPILEILNTSPETMILIGNLHIYGTRLGCLILGRWDSYSPSLLKNGI